MWKTTNGLGQPVTWYSEKEVRKYRKCLKGVIKIIEDFAEQDILTFPDLSLESNAKAIMGQYNACLTKIIKKVGKVVVEGIRNEQCQKKYYIFLEC